MQANVAALSSNAVRMVARTGRRDSESSASSFFNSTFSTDGSDSRSETSLDRRGRPRITVVARAKQLILAMTKQDKSAHLLSAYLLILHVLVLS